MDRVDKYIIFFPSDRRGIAFRARNASCIRERGTRRGQI